MQTFLCFLIMALIPLSLRLFKLPRWSPAYVFGLFWWVQFAICYVLYPGTPWSPISSLYFLICSLAVSAGFKMVDNNDKQISLNRLSNVGFNSTLAKNLIVLFTLLGFIYALVSLGKHGYSLLSFLNVNTLLQMNNQMAVARYGGTAENAGTLNQILLSFTYAAPMAGGFFFPYAKRKTEKILCFTTFLPEIIVLFSQNLKAGFIACVIFWVSGFLVSMLRIRGSIKVPLKVFIRAGIIILLIVIILMTTMVLRIGTISASTLGTVQKKFINYLFGHVGAIDDWVNSNILRSDLTLGGQTFIGISRYIGFSDRSQGIYLDTYNGPDLSTNVFTYFRGIYQDYGVIGSILFFLVFGLIMGYAYKRLVNHNHGNSFYEMILVITYSFALYFIVSIFSYASYIVAYCLFFFYAYFVCKKKTMAVFPKCKLIYR